MEIITNVTEDVMKKAAKALKAGHLVAFPTETVYGLGADATNAKAVSRVYSVKGRPTSHPLIVHISSINKLDKWTIEIPDYAIKLAKEFWPGPMTLILKRSKLVQDFITGGQDNVGIRVPAHPIALGLLSEFERLGGSGIAAPSANRFGAVSPTSAQAVDTELREFLNSKDIILNDGQSKFGIESTIINCIGDKPLIIRPGSITQEIIQTKVNLNISNHFNFDFIKAPGLLKKHYSPKVKVALNCTAKPGDGFLALSEIPTPPGVIRLATPKNIEEFAKILYSNFRKADSLNLKKLIVILPNEKGICLAIRDRVTKAAAKS
jgi:L-threonylcarbamoyladenylate synthase